MEQRHEASRCRQRIAERMAELEGLVAAVQGRTPLVRGSLYAYRRRCGKRGCRCARGTLHLGHAFCVSEGGRSRTVPVRGVDREALAECVRAYREHRRARARMVKAFDDLVAAVDELERARAIALAQVRRRRAVER